MKKILAFFINDRALALIWDLCAHYIPITSQYNGLMTLTVLTIKAEGLGFDTENLVLEFITLGKNVMTFMSNYIFDDY